MKLGSNVFEDTGHDEIKQRKIAISSLENELHLLHQQTFMSDESHENKNRSRTRTKSGEIELVVGDTKGEFIIIVGFWRFRS